MPKPPLATRRAAGGDQPRDHLQLRAQGGGERRAAFGRRDFRRENGSSNNSLAAVLAMALLSSAPVLMACSATPA